MSEERERYRVLRTSKGRPKKVRDRDTKDTVERVLAQVQHSCDYHGCPSERVIVPGTEYAKVTNPLRVRRLGGFRAIPDTKVWHFECLPPELRPVAALLGVES